MTAQTCPKHGAWDDELLSECPECLKDKALDAKLNAFAAGCADILGGRIG